MLCKLLKYGADISARDWYARTHLHHRADDLAAVKILVEAGIEIDAIDHLSGTTALGIAASLGDLAVVEYLLNAGADAQLPNEAEWARPLARAEAQGRTDVIQRLQQNS